MEPLKRFLVLELLKQYQKYSENPENTEYLEWFLENSRNFKIDYVRSNYKFDKKIRLTLDYKEDLLQLNKIFKAFKNKRIYFKKCS